MLKICTMRHLTQRLGISLCELEELANNMPKYCFSYSTELANGKIRNFINPHLKLGKVLSAILHKLLSPLPIHRCAHGGRKGHSIKTNALVHLSNPYVLQLDLKSCYPNVHSSRVHKLFQVQLGCTTQVASILTKLTTYNYQLPQGFHTSAAILNLLCISLDTRMEQFLSTKGLVYTRYIDDIAISGHFISPDTKQKTIEIVQSEGFIVNYKKIRLEKGNIASTITGVNVSGRTLKTSKNLKQKLSRIKYYKKQEKNKFENDRLHRQQSGFENFIKYIEN